MIIMLAGIAFELIGLITEEQIMEIHIFIIQNISSSTMKELQYDGIKP